MKDNFINLPVAVIDENNCIGCGRCLTACPVDAIIGSKTWLHQILESECIGCKMCVAPCPVDCIEIKPREVSREFKINLAGKTKDNYINRQRRLAKNQLKALPMMDDSARKNIQSEIQALRRN